MPNTNLTEQQVRDIIRDELSDFATNERYTFQKHLQIFDGRNVQTGRGTGTKFGTATDQKIGFYNTTPVDQPATIADPEGGGDAGVDTPARTAIEALISRLKELGLIA